MSANTLSSEFRQAIAAAAASRLMEAGYEAMAAAQAVAQRLDGALFPDIEIADPAKAVDDIRIAVEAHAPRAEPRTPLAIARYHYDSCLAHVDDAGHEPEHAAEVLMRALLESVG